MGHLSQFHVVRKKNNNNCDSQQSPFFLPLPLPDAVSLLVTVDLKAHQNIHQEEEAIHLFVFLSALG